MSNRQKDSLLELDYARLAETPTSSYGKGPLLVLVMSVTSATSQILRLRMAAESTIAIAQGGAGPANPGLVWSSDMLHFVGALLAVCSGSLALFYWRSRLFGLIVIVSIISIMLACMSV